jgi:3',5'-cyclic-AMP phosphodiesterase
VTILAQISDLHIGVDDAESHAAAARAVDRILALHPLPDAVLVGGDTANSGAPEEHEIARELLGRLPMPVLHVAGNHDLYPERQDYTMQVGGLRLVVADTSVPGSDAGALDVERLAAEIHAAVPTVVAMHHPPLRLGMWIDGIGLPDADIDALAAVLETRPQVRAVVAGHVHRTAAGTCGGKPVYTCTAAYWQAKLELFTDEIDASPEPAAMLVHVLLPGGDLVTHVQPIPF